MVVSMERWDGKVAMVTGASSGIGAAIAEKLVQHGMKVVGLARRMERVEELSKKLSDLPGELFPFRADVTKESDIIKAIKWTTETLGPISVLINNAGIFRNIQLTSSSTEEMRNVMETNVMGLCIATREVSKIMLENKIDGHIVHISSVAAYMSPWHGLGIYCASKYSVRALTEALRKELNELGSKAKISSISPGAVDTEILDDVPQIDKEAVPTLSSEDIADATIYILSTPPTVQVHELIIKPVGEQW